MTTPIAAIEQLDYLIECYQNAAEYMKETPVGVAAPATIEAKKMRDAIAELVESDKALASIYGTLCTSMRVGSERRLAWERNFKAMRRVGAFT